MSEHGMRVVVHGVSGPAAGVVATLRDETALTVGRIESADVAVPADTFMSGLHFSLARAEGGMLLRDLGSRNGTFVDGVRVAERLLGGGEMVAAGGCTFRLAGSDQAGELMAVLCGASEPVYVVLDAARDPKIYPLLCGSGARYVSLYAGRSAVELENVAPYLAELTPGGRLMEEFVGQGWGDAWGVLLTSGRPMEEVWKQLRRSLMVTIEGEPKQAYFRFYDPRVLRVFLAGADAEQVAEFGGPIRSLMMEDSDPQVLVHFQGWGGTGSVCRVRLTGAVA